MAQVQRHRRAIATALLGLVALAFAPALAEDPGPSFGSDLYDRPVLAVDPGMHTARIEAQAVDAAGRFVVTGSDDRTVRIWSAAEGKLLGTIWIPVGPGYVGVVGAVAISPDGSTIAAGGYTERSNRGASIYLFDRESGNLIRRIHDDSPGVTGFLTFSPDGRYLAVMLGPGGLRVFDRNRDWSEAFRDDQYPAVVTCVAFARDGRLATAAGDGLIRLYAYDLNNDKANFRRVGTPILAPSGHLPRGIAFSPDGNRFAVGYFDVAAVDVLDGATFKRMGGQAPAGVTSSFGLTSVAWSRDGQTLFAAGDVNDAQRPLLFGWDRGGLGDERRIAYCGHDTAAGVDATPEGRILVASTVPCLGLMDASGKPIWTVASAILAFNGKADALRVSEDGQVVDFGYRGTAEPVLRFDVKSLALSSAPSNDGLTFAPLREGLKIDGWRGGASPTLGGRTLQFLPFDRGRGLAIASDAKRFFLGTSFSLTAFDDAGTRKWRWMSRNEVWAVNASRDGRIVVADYGDGAVRWHRADDGRELLALQVLPNKETDPAKWDWVLWTPEGYYQATPGAEGVLKWVTNHGSDSAATTLPVSAIPRLHRADALPLVLQELETARALGIAELAAGRLAVQKATGSAKPPGGVLHVLAIGVDKFGDKAGDLHLDYAAEDAHDVASALQESQKLGPEKASLYADVKIQYRPNDQADNTAIRDALDDMATSMATSSPNQDVAVILVSSHGEMIDGQFYLVPYGVDLGSKNKIIASALSATDFGKKVQAIAAHGKVLLLLDACHSGAVRPGGWATDPDAKILRDLLNMDNVTVLTSSDEKGLSEELPTWRHGALAQAFLDALTGAGDSNGVIRLTALINQMDGDLHSLTQGRQSLGQHANFGGDLFMASHY